MRRAENERSSVSGEESLATILLRIYRASTYVTQVALAKDLKVTAGAITNYFRERNGRAPTEDVLHRFVALCAQSERERVRYDKVAMRALVRERYRTVDSLPLPGRSLPPLAFSLVFRNQVRQDFSKFPVRDWRRVVEQQGLSWKVVRQMLGGRRALTTPQVRLLAKALQADADLYVSLLDSSTDLSHRRVSRERQLLAGLQSLPRTSRRDLESARRQVDERPDSRRRPKAGLSSRKKPLGGSR